jgi:hypothetical protein
MSDCFITEDQSGLVLTEERLEKTSTQTEYESPELWISHNY